MLLLHEELRSEWRRQCLEPGWSGDQPWPSKSTSFHIRYMALTFRQVNCPAISPLWGSWSSLTLRCPNMEVLGMCPAQIFSNYPNSPQTSGDIMEISITPYCGTMWQGNTAPMFWSTFQVQTWQCKWVFSPRGYSGQWSLQLASTAWPLDRSLWPFLYIGV